VGNAPDSIEAAFRDLWMKRLDLLLPVPTLLLGGLMLYLAAHPGWCLLWLVVYVLGNVGLTRVAPHIGAIRPDGPVRVAWNVFAITTIVATVGPDGHAWTLALISCAAAVFAPTLIERIVSCVFFIAAAVVASAWVGVPQPTLWVIAAVLIATTYLSITSYQSLFHVWAQAHRRGAELHETNGQLRAALATKQQFLATMSHEIRTPLNGVLGMAQLLQRTPLTDAQLDMLKTVQHSGEGLLQVLNDILDASTLEAAAVQLESVAFSPDEEVTAVVDLLRPSAAERRVDLRLSSQPMPQAVWGDPGRLRQVVLNLVGNALKFTERGHVHVQVAWANDQLCVDVVDTGIGIEPEAIPTLFEPFVQAEAGIMRRFGGTGLGLHISRRLVELMQGEITVRSELGVGSTFSIRLPAPRAPVTERATPSNPPATVPPMRVLFADDNAVNRKVTEAMLRGLGCTTVIVNDGEQAVRAALHDGPFDVVLMDCRMPVMDGLHATRQLRSSGLQTPILALTAGVTEDERAACAASGMDAVLAKPISIDGLRDALVEFQPVFRHAA